MPNLVALIIDQINCMNMNIQPVFRWLAILLFLSIHCYPSYGQQADIKATTQTKKLYKNLFSLLGKSVLFGHQDDLAYGIGWKYEKNRSDIKELTGDYPSMFGWDISGIEKDKTENIDGVSFGKMKEFIRKAYDMGTVNTISWHLDNPLNGKTAWDTTSTTVPSILPGGVKHQLYKTWLDKVAVFMADLKGTDGKAIPILFRPYHELTGSWFWWGKNECSPADYIALYRFTEDYLKKSKGIHNLIYVYNVSDFKSTSDYLERYPGDNYIDILSFDAYQYGPVSNGAAFSKDLQSKLAIQQKIAEEHGKIMAIAELGYLEIPDANWWTKVLWEGMKDYKVSYIMPWRNVGFRPVEKDNHYFAPYKGQTSAADFINFYNLDKLMFQKKASQYKLYK
ncbi:MAG: putative beta-mannanase [Pedobacter sp.]|jgi:mannan endo-1,4-beta-mannosidase|nr:putative beta-mannanase [Pedobacter sp.]